MDIKKIRLIEFPKILDKRGNLSFLEYNKQLPFEIERSYWIYDVPGGEIRGGHSYKENQEVIIALSGSFNIILNDGSSEVTYSLNRSYNGLFIPNGIWRHLENFSTNAVALIVASTKYSEADYERNFQQFQKDKNV